MRAIPTLKISISGVRGVIGDSLTPSLLARYAQAFGTYVGSGTIVIGRFTGVLTSHSCLISIALRFFPPVASVAGREAVAVSTAAASAFVRYESQRLH